MATEVGVRLQTTLTVEEAVQRLISTIDEEFDDIVTYVPLTRARTLPCGHNFNEPTIRQLSVDRQGNKTCPSCRAPFRHTAANTAIRNVVNARLAHQQAVSTNPSVEAMAQLERAALNSPSMEATAHYEKGKRFAAQGDFEQAIQGCLAAITLSPDFAKAHAYLHFLLDQQGRVPSVPQSSELVSTGAPNQDSERLCNRQTVGSRVTRSTGVEERGAVPRRNPSLASRVSTQPAVQSSGLVDDFRQFFGSLYELNMLAIQSIYSVTGADRACEQAGMALGNRIREVSNRRGIV